MGRAPRARFPHLARVALIGGGLWFSGCGSAARAGPEPEVSLAGSAEAQAEFRELRQQWIATPLDARAALEPAFTRFVQKHPSDHQGRWVRIYLAWISLQRGDSALAERWLALAEPGAAGAASDLLQVVRAAVELRAGRAAAAYEKLQELEGRLIDADDRLLCLDQLVLAALEAGRHHEAVLHMLELAAQGARRHRERLWHSLEPRLAQVPLGVLEESLPNLSSDHIQGPSLRNAEKAAAVAFLRQAVLDLLSRSAIQQRNVELAQRLLATGKASDSGEGEGSELVRLATRAGLAKTIAGRTLGLLLQLEDPTLRQRSMEVASGIASALDLPNRAPGRDALVLATLELDEDVPSALGRLSGDGASLLVAGVDAAAARAAADFASREHVPLLLLHEPAGDRNALSEFVRVIGTDEVSANEPLRQALARRFDTLIAVGSPDAPCPQEPPHDASSLGIAAGGGQRHGLWVMGDAQCARNVLFGLEGDARSWTVGLGIDALSATPEDPGDIELWGVGAGALPQFRQSRDAAALRWLAKKGRSPSFYEGLGHDVAALAEAALPEPPPTPLREPAQVERQHRRVLDALGRATPRLWTSDGSTFGPDRRWPREFRAFELSPTSASEQK